MNKITVSLLSLLIAFVVSDLLPEEAAEKFLAALDKHVEFKDKDIFDEDFYRQVKNEKFPREKSILSIFNAHDWVKGEWHDHTAVFTNDGFLKIKFYKDKKPSGVILAKPNKNVEGGFKIHRWTLV